jgi:hypothetical protein
MVEGTNNMSATAVRAEQRTHEQKLDLLAEVAVRVGLGLTAGQELVMTASLDAVPLARRITEQAYRAGASLVTTLYADDEAALMRYHFAPDESFDHAAKWLYDGMGAAFKSGAARLAITGGNPALLSNEDSGQSTRNCLVDGLPTVSVAHYGQQNGDAMRDPEMLFEMRRDGSDIVLAPYWRNDYLSIEQYSSYRDDSQKLFTLSGLKQQHEAFARTWDRNIRSRGFYEAFVRSRSQ